MEALDEATFLARFEASAPVIERLDAEGAAARADVMAAGVRADPSIALDREEVFAGGGMATSYARLTVPIDLSGRRARRVDAARAAAGAVEADNTRRRFELTIDALRVFHGAANARAHVELLQREREALLRAVETVRRRATAGASSGYDLQRLELALAAYDDLLASAEAERETARAEVAVLVGRPGERIDARADLALPARPASAEALAASLVERRDDHRAAMLRVESAEAAAGEAARAWVPSLDLSAGAMSQDVGDDTAFGYTIGLALSVPIFDRGRAASARARALRRAALADARALELRVPGQVLARREALDRVLAQVERLATDQLARLDDLLRAAESGYREGETGVVELLDAYETARETRVRDLALRHHARLAALELALVLGQLP